MSWSTNRRTGKHFQGRPQGTAFNPAEHPGLAKEVHAETPADARESVRDLDRSFREAKTHTGKERIRKATQLEANRLSIGAHNHNNSAEARKSLAARARIFDSAASRMDRQLRGERSAPKGAS